MSLLREGRASGPPLLAPADNGALAPSTRTARGQGPWRRKRRGVSLSGRLEAQYFGSAPSCLPAESPLTTRIAPVPVDGAVRGSTWRDIWWSLVILMCPCSGSETPILAQAVGAASSVDHRQSCPRARSRPGCPSSEAAAPPQLQRCSRQGRRRSGGLASRPSCCCCSNVAICRRRRRRRGRRQARGSGAASRSSSWPRPRRREPLPWRRWSRCRRSL